MLPPDRPVLVEVLSFSGCPGRQPAIDLAERVSRELAPHADVRVIDVEDDAHAASSRFLGSPSIRVDGRDIEPGSQERTSYGRGCRLYPGAAGVSHLPDEEWLRAALAR